MTNRIPTVMANSTALNGTSVCPTSRSTCFTSVYCSQRFFQSPYLWKVLQNLRKVQGQIRNCETSVIAQSFVDPTHQIIIYQRRTPPLCLIVHTLSSFIEHPNPFPNHAYHSSHCHHTLDRSGDESHLVAHSWCSKNELQTVLHSRQPLQLFNAQEQT